MPEKAPEQVETARLVLRRPRAADAEAIFARYASDTEVVRYVGWPQHQTLDDTRAFLAFSESEWEKWPGGPYVILVKVEGPTPKAHVKAEGETLVGGTGFAFETPWRAMTGYVLAKDTWGRGYATEALRAIVDLAPSLGVRRLFAYCHAEHRPSWRVLEKGGMQREGTLRCAFEFPNLAPGEPQDVLIYSRIF